ncbi:hypothetical protein KY342_00540 [Candidatus Woesearchaeota archaeon]|nr:hypothetical protein [Candidatus Woesearchaeota archaeon]
MEENKMGARQMVLEKALSINKIILLSFKEALEEKKVEEIEKQIEETEEKIRLNGTKEE